MQDINTVTQASRNETVTLRMDPLLKKEAHKASIDLGISLSEFMNRAVRASLDRLANPTEAQAHDPNHSH